MAASDSNRSESPLHLPEHSPPQGSVNHSLAPVNGSSAYGTPMPINPLPPGLAAAPDMMSLLKALKRHWLLATTLGLLAATLASAGVWYFLPVKYNAEIMLNVATTKLFKVDTEGYSPFSPLTITTLPKTRSFIRKTLEEKDVANLAIVREQLDPVDWLRRALEVKYVSPELLTISLTGYNPPELVTVVNAVGKIFAQELGAAENAIRKDRVSKLQTVLNNLQLVVNREKQSYKDLIDNTGAYNAAQIQNKFDYERKRRERLIDDKVRLLATLDELVLLQSQDTERKEASPVVKQSEILKELRETREVKELNEEIERLKEATPKLEPMFKDKNHKTLVAHREKLQKAEEQLTELEKKLTPKIAKAIAARKRLQHDETAEDTKSEIAKLKKVIKYTDDEIDRLGKEIRTEGSRSFDLEEMRSKFIAAEGVVDTLRKQQALFTAEADFTPSSASLRDTAAATMVQDAKKQIMMAGGAGVAALAMVLFGIAYWEFRIRRINTAEDVVYGLGWRLVGQLPPLPDRSRGGLLRRHVDPHYWQNLMTESVDATRTMILHAARVEGLRTVMVTSAVSGEGKTSLSCHLACSLARAGRKTLLLDCDLRNPAAHRLFELPAEPGLCEVLRGEVQLADVIRATPAANLWLVPAGQFDEQALQMLTLSQEGFSPLLEQLKTQFDFILIDSSPVLPVADTLVIGQNVDVVVFSLLRDVSRIPSVYAAYQRLTTLGIRILGAVVNGVDTGGYGYTSQYTKQTV